MRSLRKFALAAGASAAALMLALTSPVGAKAATVQLMAVKVSACPASVAQTPLAGFVYVAVDPDGNLCGATALANTTGFNVSVTPTIQNASYAAGACMGGVQAITLPANATVLNSLTLSSQGGLATSKVLYVFSANPTASTCTDKSAFVLGAADVSKLLIAPAQSALAPVAPISGTTVASATAAALGVSLTAGVGKIWVAIVETATETPATTGDLVLTAGGL